MVTYLKKENFLKFEKNQFFLKNLKIKKMACVIKIPIIGKDFKKSLKNLFRSKNFLFLATLTKNGNFLISKYGNF